MSLYGLWVVAHVLNVLVISKNGIVVTLALDRH